MIDARALEPLTQSVTVQWRRRALPWRSRRERLLAHARPWRLADRARAIVPPRMLGIELKSHEHNMQHKTMRNQMVLQVAA